MKISEQTHRHEEQPLLPQTGVGALMPALGQSRAWGQQEEAEAPAPHPDRLQPAGRRSSDRNMPRGWTNFLGKHGGGAGQGDTAGLGALSLKPWPDMQLLALWHPQLGGRSGGKGGRPWPV